MYKLVEEPCRYVELTTNYMVVCISSNYAALAAIQGICSQYKVSYMPLSIQMVLTKQCSLHAL